MRFGFAVAAKKNGTKRRAEREGIECRKDNGGSNGNGKLLINFAGNTGHKADWDKMESSTKVVATMALAICCIALTEAECASIFS